MIDILPASLQPYGGVKDICTEKETNTRERLMHKGDKQYNSICQTFAGLSLQGPQSPSTALSHQFTQPDNQPLVQSRTDNMADVEMKDAASAPAKTKAVAKSTKPGVDGASDSKKKFEVKKVCSQSH